MGMNGQPSFAATRGPKMKPRASGPATAVGSASATDSAKDSVICFIRVGLASTGVMSLNCIPGMGKSGTVRMHLSNASRMSMIPPLCHPGAQWPQGGSGYFFTTQNTIPKSHSKVVSFPGPR